MKKRILLFLIIVSVLGILNSLYLTYIHYSDSGSKICDINSTFQCDIVNKSVYSDLGGLFSLFGISIILPIPLSILGALFFITLLAIYSSLYLRKPFFGFSAPDRIRLILIISIAGICFGLFLMYVQAFVLRAWCLFCLMTDALLLMTLIASFFLKKAQN